MRVDLLIFSMAAAIAWSSLFIVSANAVATMGVAAAGSAFLSNFNHPWRAQFGVDLSIHLLFIAAWLIWRTPNKFLGIVSAILAINLGALFTLPYLVVAAWRAGGVAAALVPNRLLMPRSTRTTSNVR